MLKDVVMRCRRWMNGYQSLGVTWKAGIVFRPAKNHIKEKDLGEGGKMKDHLVSHTDLLVCH